MTKQDLKFIHLRVHSSYSLSEGAIAPGEVALLAANENMPAVAVTDSGNLFGLLEISMGCTKAGVQAIPAIEIELSEKTENESIKLGKAVLIAKNEAGYLNLLKLGSQSFFNSEDHTKPHVDYEDFLKCKEGIILLTGGYNGFINNFIRNKRATYAKQVLENLKNEFAEGELYIELNRFKDYEEKDVENQLLNIATELNIPLVATNNVLFPTAEMHEAQEILMCIADARVIIDEGRKKSSNQSYFKSQTEMAKLFEDLPEALENTIKIAKKCNYIVSGEAPMLPNFPTLGGRSDEDELRDVCFKGLCERLGISEQPTEKQKEEYQNYFDRLDYEVGVICKMGFPGYFLIVSDFIRWAKENDIPVGPGRGSGAGSVVAWAMQITNLDPIRFGLLFERFLNPERVSMPDFDIDFCQERRGEVIKYVQKKYGHTRVAQIITFGKLQARAVLRDVGRVLQIPYPQVDRICKMIPFNPVDPVTLEKAVDMDRELQNARKEDEVIAHLINIALQLEGMHRHASTHAAGVVIGPKDLVEIVPLYTDHKSDMPTTQYSMKYSEAAGLVKFDFLGLKTLTLISKAVKLVEKNESVKIDIDDVEFDDKKTFELLAEGKGVGVFQMESAGMRDAMRKMQIDSIEDIIALISLYRPGPMENIPTYIARKLGREKPDYIHEMLVECLKETHGVIIYQEQVMQIAQILAGYTLGGADLLRRAMGKKVKAEMDAQREIFVEGSVENGVDKKKADEIFDLVAKFAGYGFNKSHAAAYAAIGYQTAYLKAHYPYEFFVATMNQEIGDTDKLLVFKEEAKRMGLRILPPDINQSYPYFTTEIDKNGEKSIRYGFGALKGVGIDAMEKMCEERVQNGAFKDITDFILRSEENVMNKRQLESLALSGAFDALDSNRRKLFEHASEMVAFNKYINHEKKTQQESLFAAVEDPNLNKNFRFTEFNDYEAQEKTFKEFDAIGFYLNNHPIDSVLPLISKSKFTFIEELDDKVPETKKPKEGERKYVEGFKTSLIGVANKVVHRSRGGKRFSYFFLSDPTGMTEVNIFNEDLIAKSRDFLNSNTTICVEVEIRRDEGGMRIIASNIYSVESYFEMVQMEAEITLQESDLSEEKIQALRDLVANKTNGEIPVKLKVKTGEGVVVDMKLPREYALSTGHFASGVSNDFDMKIKN